MPLKNKTEHYTPETHTNNTKQQNYTQNNQTHFISCFSTNFFFLLSKSTISVTYLHYLYTFKLPKIFCILKNESHSAFFQVSSFKIQIQIPRFHFFSVFYPSTPKGFLFFFLHFFVETLFLARFASLIRFDFFP